MAGFKKGRQEEKCESRKGAVGFPSVPNLISPFPLSPSLSMPAMQAKDHRDTAFTVMGDHLRFKCTEGVGPGVFVAVGGGEGGAFPQTIPCPVSRF